MNHSQLHSEMAERLLFYSLPLHFGSRAGSWRRESRSQLHLTGNFCVVRAHSVGSTAHLTDFHPCLRSSLVWNLLEWFVDFNGQWYLRTSQYRLAYFLVHSMSYLRLFPIRVWMWQYFAANCVMTTRLSSPCCLFCYFGPQISFLCEAWKKSNPCGRDCENYCCFQRYQSMYQNPSLLPACNFLQSYTVRPDDSKLVV